MLLPLKVAQGVRDGTVTLAYRRWKKQDVAPGRRFTTAAEAGAEVMILETGVPQPEGIALYESSGYERIPGFGHYAWAEDNRCFARRLPKP